MKTLAEAVNKLPNGDMPMEEYVKVVDEIKKFRDDLWLKNRPLDPDIQKIINENWDKFF